MGRMLSSEESPDRPTAKRPPASPASPASVRSSQHHSRSEESGSKREASCEVVQERVKKRLVSNLSPSSDTPNKAAAPPSSPAHTDMTAVFQARYVEEELLGQGGFGAVYAGFRKHDQLQVAIKHIPQKKINRAPMVVNGQECSIPQELLLLSMAGAGCSTIGSSAAVTLIDCFELDQELILVMEHPVPCIDLFQYIVADGLYLAEAQAKVIMRQIVDVFIELHSKGVLHRDIKPENILVQTESDGPRIRVIDFGCGTKLEPGSYTELPGTQLYTPPEFFMHGSYEGDALTVWQLGVLLYSMLHEDTLFSSDLETILKKPNIRKELSRDCRQFLLSCLTKISSGRPKLEDLRSHRWFQ
ncbi:serine/threonine-protein kinase pim-2-like [Genypterus blacodes]|uniref:serine/threonine-protein kinase pim-2-like n=1 Tax=Genypterus blacodes TaxID=154954 RepID=UPI003F77654C